MVERGKPARVPSNSNSLVRERGTCLRAASLPKGSLFPRVFLERRYHFCLLRICFSIKPESCHLFCSISLSLFIVWLAPYWFHPYCQRPSSHARAPVIFIRAPEHHPGPAVSLIEPETPQVCLNQQYPILGVRVKGTSVLALRWPCRHARPGEVSPRKTATEINHFADTGTAVKRLEVYESIIVKG